MLDHSFIHTHAKHVRTAFNNLCPTRCTQFTAYSSGLWFKFSGDLINFKLVKLDSNDGPSEELAALVTFEFKLSTILWNHILRQVMKFTPTVRRVTFFSREKFRFKWQVMPHTNRKQQLNIYEWNCSCVLWCNSGIENKSNGPTVNSEQFHKSCWLKKVR